MPRPEHGPVNDQGARGISAKLERTATGIKVAVPSINANYEGVNMGDSVMGTFKQHGLSFPLTLKPGSVKRNRPPENASSQTPVLLMVTGSGLQNRDEEFFEHKPFAVIADALARQGIATLRYDDRGFGESTGDLANITTEDLKNDALAGVELLRKQFKRVGILGHSEGGTIGLMLAAEGKVDFVVSLAGMVVSGEKTLLEQNRWMLGHSGYPQEVVDRYCTALESLFDGLKAGGNLEPVTDGLPTELAKNLPVVKVQSGTPYMRHFLGLDLTDRLGKITCPVLALNGTKDRQVSSDENLNTLRSGLAEYKDIEETFAPEVLGIIVAWMKGL